MELSKYMTSPSVELRRSALYLAGYQCGFEGWINVSDCSIFL